MSEPFSLTGKRALVTGASRGIGRAMATALAGAGADVICVSTQRSGTDETACAVQNAGRQAWQLEADLSDRAQVAALAERAQREAGSVDILVNAAGTIRRKPAVDFALEDWDDVLSVNLDAVFQLCQTFGRQMIERRAGKIVNIASLLSFSGGITVPAYTASKHAVAGITKALANEWARFNVQVNAIAPGYIRTDNTRALQQDPTRMTEITARIPAGRWGEPADLAAPSSFWHRVQATTSTGTCSLWTAGWMAR